MALLSHTSPKSLFRSLTHLLCGSVKWSAEELVECGVTADVQSWLHTTASRLSAAVGEVYTNPNGSLQPSISTVYRLLTEWEWTTEELNTLMPGAVLDYLHTAAVTMRRMCREAGIKVRG